MPTRTDEKQVVWHQATVTRKDREAQNGHRSFVLWFTGLSASGKSTLAHAIEAALHQLGCHTYVFDGDNVRHGLCADLGFSAEDRHENVRRVGEMSKLFIEAGVIALTAFISPFKVDREAIRRLVGEDYFIEIYLHCTLKTCEARDRKGLYQKARKGEIENFTGISSPYEVPDRPDLAIDTEKDSLQESVEKVMTLLVNRFPLLPSSRGVLGIP